MLNKYLYLKDGSERIHIVIKIDDLIKYVKAPVKLALLENDLEDIQVGRKSEGKDPIPDYLVINMDEPYAALVENIILGKATIDDIPEALTEKLLKEYAEDLFEEFQQIERFEKGITLKDIADILQISGAAHGSGAEYAMKFYEFNNFGYYALIGAETEEAAVNYYAETVADIKEDDGPPDEITKEEARAKLIGGCKQDEAEALNEFDRYTSKQDPYLVLIDGSLI